MMRLQNDDSPHRQLQLRWAATALLWVLLLIWGYRLLAEEWQVEHAQQWLLQAGIGCAYLLGVLHGALKYNYRTGEGRLLPGFGAGNAMTLLRGGLVAALLGFLLQPWPEGRLAWLPAALYTLACLADFLDGYLARVTNHTTEMGERLDMTIDGLGVMAASLLAIQYGQVPVWYLPVALARYIFLGGIWLRKKLGKPVYDLQPSVRRRGFAGVQMGFLFFILMPVFSPPGTHIAAVLFAIPFLVGFVFDWLAVSGNVKRVPSRGEAARPHPSALQAFFFQWLPVALRLLAAVLLVYQLAAFMLAYPGSGGSAAAAQIIIEDAGLLVIILAQGVVIVLLTLGAGGRTAAITGLGLLGIQQFYTGLTPLQVMLAALYTAILYLGTGSLSLWKPEERWIYRRAGEQPS